MALLQRDRSRATLLRLPARAADAAATAAFDRMWADLAGIGRHPGTGGYRRFAWTREDADLREWFAGEAAARGLDLVDDRAGNLWAWWGDPDGAATDGPGVVLGSHLDSVPDGGAFDGPLGVVSALAAVDALRARGFVPARPLGVAVFGDEEGARFGVACAGSRLITGALAPDRARALADGDGVSMAEALTRAGRDPAHLGRDDETLRRVATFVELHVEQGRGLDQLDRAVAVGTGIWPHGRWRVELPGEANHAGTTALDDRRDPMIAYASAVLAARGAATWHDALATCGKVVVEPNGVNAVPSRVTAWLDARAPGAGRRARRRGGGDRRRRGARGHGHRGVVDGPDGVRHGAGGPAGGPARGRAAAGHGRRSRRRDPRGGRGARRRCCSSATRPGVSHAPAEHAERADCLAGVAALADVAADLAGTGSRAVRFWAAHALLPGGLTRDVTFTVDGGRFTGVDPGTGPGDAQRLPGRRAARLRRRPLPRLPPGAARAAPTTRGGTFWTWRERMYAVAARLDPDSYLALARAAFAERALAGVTAVGEFHYLHHGPDGRPYADPNAMGHALAQAAAEAGIRLTLLDTCYLTADVDGRPVEGVQRRFSDGTADAWAERVAALRDGPGLRIGVAAHSVRAVPRAALPVVDEAAGGRPLHVHLSEQPAENAACLAAHGLTPTGLLAAEGLLGPATTAVHATHLTGADIALLGGSRTTACLCPTTERDLADGLGPARALARRRVPARARRRPARGHRPLRGGAGPGDARAAGVGGARPVHSGDAARRAHRARLSRLGRRRAPGTRGARRPRRRPARHAAHRRRATPRRCCSRRPPRTSTPCWSTGGSSSRAGGTCSATSARCCRPRSRRCGRTHEQSSSSPGSGSSPRTTPSSARCHDAAVVADGEAITWVGPAARAPAADRRIDVGGRAVVPGFVDSHTHLVFAGDRAAEFAARMRGERYDGGGIASTVAATRAADDAALRELLGTRIAELRAQGTTTVEIKSGYGLTVADEERALPPGRRGDGRDDVPRGARRSGRRGPRRVPRAGHRPDARRLRPARAMGRRVLRAGAARTRSTATRPAPSSRPAARRAWACGCTATSSAPARGWRWPSSWAPRASTTAPT